jgi:ubiquinone/menaquinone biosynthesis C-methylase UbiE
MWNAVAEHWGNHAAYIDAKGEGLNKVLLDNAAIRATDQVLELACGAGGLGMDAAAYAGHVVITDVAEAMVAIAADRLSMRRIANATTAVRDIEDIAEPNATFDAVICREGFMFAVDPSAAFAEAQRVLRPGGRLSAAVWGPRERNPWLGLVMDAVSAQLDRPMPPPGMPGPFALSDATQLIALVRAAGFHDVEVTECDVPTRSPSFDDWYARTTALAGPLTNVLAMLDADATAELAARVRELVTPYEQSDGSLEFPGVSLVVRAIA